MTNSIELASNLSLPPSAVTDTFAFFGTRGTGKTYGAGVTVEAFHAAGAQVVVVDPVGVWYGLRLAKDGRGRGLDIPVFGGIHADVPLEPTGGELVARIVVEQGVSVILDVSMFTLGQQHRFVLAFTTALFNLKKATRRPIHVVFDEAHEFVPQQPGPAEAEMLGAVRRLWKMGRNFGIGASLISPRPAEVNKGVVNLTERMFCGRLKGPQDRKALEGWASAQDMDTNALDDLPRLPSGELLFWGERGPERVRFFPKKTFDASKTPEHGDARPTGALPKIDLDAVRTAMAATIEEAKASDPKALRARIAELEKVVAAKVTPGASGKTKIIEKQVIDPREVDRLRALVGQLQEHDEAFLERRQKFGARIGEIVSHLSARIASPPPAPLPAASPRPLAPSPSRQSSPVSGDLTRCARALLNVLASRGTATDSQISALSGYKKTSSTFANGMSELRTKGYFTGGKDGRQVTAAGREACGPVEAPPTGPALLDYWRSRLGACEWALLARVYEAGTISRSDLAKKANYSPTSSTFANGMSGLRTLDLIHGPPGGDLSIADVFRE